GAGGPVFAGVRGGLGQLVTAVAAATSAQVTLGTAVRQLRRAPDGGWQLTVGPARAPEVVIADAVVLAVPAAPGRRLLSECLPAVAGELAGIEYAGVALVTLVYRAADLPAEHASSGFLVPAVERRVTKAVTRFSAKWGHVAAERPDLTVIRASVGRYGEAADLQRDDDELLAAVGADVAEALRPAGPPVESAVTRWGGALPQYAPGHVERVARIHAGVAPADGLAVCGAAYDGVGIPACIGSGTRAADKVLADLSRRRPGVGDNECHG
ncbi:MAG: FAD-dependent oxidoreductase, partial [Actinomycetota bacterium]|nr:FAD-dependent oxidoreductase [Actinomycetota bacterium]